MEQHGQVAIRTTVVVVLVMHIRVVGPLLMILLVILGAFLFSLISTCNLMCGGERTKTFDRMVERLYFFNWIHNF